LRHPPLTYLPAARVCRAGAAHIYVTFHARHTRRRDVTTAFCVLRRLVWAVFLRCCHVPRSWTRDLHSLLLRHTPTHTPHAQHTFTHTIIAPALSLHLAVWHPSPYHYPTILPSVLPCLPLHLLHYAAACAPFGRTVHPARLHQALPFRCCLRPLLRVARFWFGCSYSAGRTDRFSGWTRIPGKTHYIYCRCRFAFTTIYIHMV